MRHLEYVVVSVESFVNARPQDRSAQGAACCVEPPRIGEGGRALLTVAAASFARGASSRGRTEETHGRATANAAFSRQFLAAE